MTGINDLANKMENNAELLDAMKEDPQKTMKIISAAGSPLASDFFVYRAVVVGLCSAIIITIIGAIVLAAFGKTLPEGVMTLGATAVGAVAGLLAPAPSR